MPNPRQMSLFGDDPQPQQPAHDPRALPIIIADKWDFPLQCHDVDGVDYYAVQDWLRGISQLSDVRGLTAQMKRRNPETFTACKPLEYKSSDGKKYKRDYAPVGNLYSMVQHMGVNTGVSKTVLAYLVKSGVKMDEYRLDPEAAVSDALDSGAWAGRDAGWKEARAWNIIARKDFTKAISEIVSNLSPDFYMQTTEQMYKILWERATAQLRGDMGLVNGQNTRDGFSTYALIYTRLAEMVATDRLRDHDTVPMSLATEIIYDVCKLIKGQVDATAKALGIDLITGRPKLTDGK